MFFLFLVLLVGGAYVYHRFQSVSNKGRFFKSAFFISIAGSVMIMLCSVLLVNMIPNSTKQNNLLTADTLSKTFEHQTPDYHYNLIKSSRDKSSWRTLIHKEYEDLADSPDSALVSLGHFGLGVFDLVDESYEDALAHFNKAPLQNMPWLHYCRGEVYRLTNKNTLAEQEFNLELKTSNGNCSGTLESLAKIYYAGKKLDALEKLSMQGYAPEVMPAGIMRSAALFTHDYPQYIYWAYRSIVNHTTAIGLTAAIAILLTWLFYLYRLDIFSKRRLMPIVLMFASGIASTIFIFIFLDLADWLTTWHMNGDFFNDLVYCIVRIGTPEESVKILPFLILLSIKGSFKNPVDYIIYASASALGFAFIENLLYFHSATSGIIHGRAYFSVIGHMVD